MKYLLLIISLSISVQVWSQCATSGTISTDCTQSGNWTINGTTLTINAGVTVTVTGNITVRSGATVNASGAFINAVDFADTNGANEVNGGEYTLSGTFNTAGGGDFTMDGVTLNAVGSSSISGSNITMLNSTIAVASMGANLSSWTITNTSITTSGTGDMEFEDATIANSTFTVGGDLFIGGGNNTVSNSDIDVGIGYATNTGQNAMTMNGGATLSLSSGSTLDIKGDVVNNEINIDGSDVNITGNFDNAGAEIVEVVNGGSLSIGGNFNNTGSGDVTALTNGIIFISGDFDNTNGSIDINGGGLVVDGDFTGNNPVVTGGGTGCDGGGGGCCGSPGLCDSLPVTLTFFSASAQSNHVLLAWGTASELNNDYFNVYRSDNGFNFDVIQKVNGHGTTNELVEYSIEDYQVSQGVYYYRLEQVDFDGKNELFSIIQVDFMEEGLNDIELYPMPVSSGQDFYVTHRVNNDETINASILSISGKKASKLGFIYDSNRIRFLSSKLALSPGIYMVDVLIGQKRFVRRVSIQ